MAYTLRALILRSTDTRGFTDSQLIQLDAGIAVVPVEDERVDIDELAAAMSASRPIAAVTAEFFGGIGEQTAVVWDRGELAFGPVFLDEDDSRSVQDTPISQALRFLGVQRTADQDEFDVAGLGRLR
ncbi:hypothetical protein D5S17_28295 [Pseudonocardiaceae bacterium YIM PH 21723]|nr:hypothetical protein D5S17_28295 [Pseudonocardiaceae bacterium YIM PH 21723]